MVWVVDKKIVRHLLEEDGQLVEIPVHTRFEYQSENGKLVEGTLTTKTIYNEPSVVKAFPNIDLEQLHDDIEKSVRREVLDRIALGE